MQKLINKYYSFHAIKIEKLNGYENVNYQITCKEKSYVFKTYPWSSELFDEVTAETDILNTLNSSLEGKFPVPVKNANNKYVEKVELDGGMKIIRMLSYIEGELLAKVEHNRKLFASFGTFLASMDKELSGCNNYIIRSKQFKWDIQYFQLNKKYIKDLPDAQDRKVVEYFFQQFDELVLPVLPDLRRSIIHNDANDFNVVVKDNEVCGIFDFGDMVYTPLINELAIAIAYALLDKENPIEYASYIIKAYHKILPLESREIDILYYLIASRLCTSAINSAYHTKQDPGNNYISLSEKSVLKLLHKWLGINPVFAKNTFRSAAGMYVETPKSVSQVITERHKAISPVLGLSYAKPIYMNRSAFQYMYDEYGNTFLDAYNNIPHVGHSHPKVVTAGKKQMAKLNTNTRYIYDELSQYAAKLLSKFPASLNKVYFVNSGSEASDLAIRMAKTYTGLNNVLVTEYGYHGNTQTGIDISDYKFNHKKGTGQKGYIIKTNIPDTYRGKYKNNDGSAGKTYAQDVITDLQKIDKPVAAFISEPIVGCGGQVPLAKGYLEKLYPAIRMQGGVCISDEVQTGFGRLGNYFWGYEAHDVVPDIVVIGKPMGNGHPMGAVITGNEIAESFEKGPEFFSSFGGNPVSCAIGMAVLDVLEEEELQENAKQTGNYYKKSLEELSGEFECVGDVRGMGLFLGIEIVKDRVSLEPDTGLAGRIKNELRNRNILISTDGPYDSVLKSKPPLCFSRDNVDQVIQNLFEILNSQFYK
ncbi:MAG: aminotransferase class III-fold pyridoxal phosphate-dependent enzyme [Bacteroidota bacterium]|nr:aminotransferase class III-fold pyridoxal phosphate-dependent enzyme [Bacteroidota bacterium]